MSTRQLENLGYFERLLCFINCLPIIMILSSCATTRPSITIPKDLDMHSEEVSKNIPLRAGLYLSHKLRSEKIAFVIGNIPIADVLIGDVLSYNCEEIIRRIFQAVIILDPLEGLSDSSVRKYDVIVTPELIKLEPRITGGPFRWNYDLVVQTTMRWDIVSPDAKQIYSSTIKSDEIKVKWRSWEENLREGFIMSLKDHFQKAQQDIYSNNWWKKQWWKATN